MFSVRAAHLCLPACKQTLVISLEVDACSRPGKGGKIDLGDTLIDAASFVVNTSVSRIYTKQNLSFSPGPTSGPGGHIVMEQRRGNAHLDLQSAGKTLFPLVP